MKHLFLLTLVTLLVISSASYTGKTIHYRLVIDWSFGSPDGVQRRVIAVNNQFPGPTLEGNTGDTFIIDVVNKLDRSISIHWHGLFQEGTPQMDGASFVNQCPIYPGASFTYQFTVPDQYGTYWYHGHFMNELIDGCKGALIIHRAPDDPEPYLYSAEAILQVSDWYHSVAEVLWDAILFPPPGVIPDSPIPDSVLVNGVGQLPICYDGDDSCKYNVIKVSTDGLTRIRLINIGAFEPIIVSVDGHKLLVIETDGIDVTWNDLTPEDINNGNYDYYVSHIRIDVAQRYSFLAVPINGQKPNEGDKFWIRAVLDDGQFAGGATTGLGGISPTYGGYKGQFSTAEKAENSIKNLRNNYRQNGSHQQQKKHHMKMFHGPNHQGPSYSYPSAGANVTDGGVTISLGILCYGSCSGFPQTEDCNYDNARTLSSIDCEECLPCSDIHPVENLSPPQPTHLITVEIDLFPGIINGQFAHFNNISCAPDMWGTTGLDIARASEELFDCLNYKLTKGMKLAMVINNHDDGEHPMHLHGHAFWVLAQGETLAGDYNPRNSSQPGFNWNNPIFRDTVTVNPFSYLVVMFEVGNFGMWPFHCHIQWHMMGGLSLTFNELPDDIIYNLGALKQPRPCVYVPPPDPTVTDANVLAAYRAGRIGNYTNSFLSVSPGDGKKSRYH